MKTVVRMGSICAVLLAVTMAAPAASAADKADLRSNTPIATMDVKGVQVDERATEETKQVIAAEPAVAAAAANVCGSGYTISVRAARYGTYATAYTWTNGKTTGDSYNDKPICAVLFNDTGVAHYMGIRLKDNYTSTPDVQDFGTYSTYAGPVYQNKGYCGVAYSYMKVGSNVVVDNNLTVGACN